MKGLGLQWIPIKLHCESMACNSVVFFHVLKASLYICSFKVRVCIKDTHRIHFPSKSTKCQYTIHGSYGISTNRKHLKVHKFHLEVARLLLDQHGRPGVQTIWIPSAGLQLQSIAEAPTKSWQLNDWFWVLPRNCVDYSCLSMILYIVVMNS